MFMKLRREYMTKFLVLFENLKLKNIWNAVEVLKYKTKRNFHTLLEKNGKVFVFSLFIKLNFNYLFLNVFRNLLKQTKVI